MTSPPRWAGRLYLWLREHSQLVDRAACCYWWLRCRWGWHAPRWLLVTAALYLALRDLYLTRRVR